MDFNHLKAFLEVADKKSFSRSAESLKLTQPAISKRIAALETELSSRLFDRVGKNIQLTEAGRLLLPSARQIDRELSRIEDVICNLDKAVSGVLHIHSCEHIGTHHLPSILTPFRHDHPNVDIDLRFASTIRILRDIEEAQVDLGLCAYPEDLSLSAKLRSIEIWSDQVVAVAANNHPLVRSKMQNDKKITLEELSWSPSILPASGSPTRSAIDNKLHAANQSVPACVEAKDFDTIKKMVSGGLGWAYLPGYLVDSSLTVLPLKEPAISYSIALVMHREHTLTRAAEAFTASLPVDRNPLEPFNLLSASH